MIGARPPSSTCYLAPQVAPARFLPLPSTLAEKITVERCGGVVVITYLPDQCAWSWSAHGSDGTRHEAE